MLAVLLGCGLRRSELTDLSVDHLQRREEHWAIVDLVGKGGHIRTIPVPDWVKQTCGASFKIPNAPAYCFTTCHTTFSVISRPQAMPVRHTLLKTLPLVGRAASIQSSIDLRRSCARLCHNAGGELEQIQFLLGHVSVQTTEKYLDCKQRFRAAWTRAPFRLRDRNPCASKQIV